ncbi:MAG: oxidoreductase [Verrucomicrobia bacterium]|nr:oxidoreductase [Verrucomicrobiota bacterium]
MKTTILLTTLIAMPTLAAEIKEVRLMTLDPGHFHASLVQKEMYPQVNPVVHVYAPGGPELEQHLKRIELFNTRSENPTRWEQKIHTGRDFLAKMLKEKPGNVVVISGNNAKKAQYILACIQAGLNVLADKPMAITPADFRLLEKAFVEARKRGVFLYDIMTERYEITTILQRELSRHATVFGRLEDGSPDNPAITKESVHYYSKLVAGKPLVRPPWFYDVKQQGEGIVDVTTHLVDMIQWECFPGQALHPREVNVLSARRWQTPITLAEFQKTTGFDRFPDYLKPNIDSKNVLQVHCNGAFVYTLRSVHAKISVEWKHEAPPGTGDTHYSMMRGTKAALVIRQGQEQNYKPILYVEKRTRTSDDEFERALRIAVGKIANEWPGIEARKNAAGWEIVVPDKYKVGHEAHFAQVTRKYLEYLATGRMIDWEVPNMITKYSTIMRAYKLSR